MSREKDRQSELDEAYKAAWAGWSGWQTAVKNDLKAYGGDPFTPEDKRIAKKRNQRLMSFPQLRRVIKWVSGYEREHRLSIVYDPQEGGDEVTASQMTAVGLWALQHNNGYHIISDAFEGAMRTGINLVNPYNDRNLNTRYERYLYNQFLLDPTFTRIDLEDCHFGILRKYVTAAEAKMLFPGREGWISRLKTNPTGTDQRFSNYPKPTIYGERLLTLDEFQQRDTIERKIIIIRPTMEEIPFDGSNSQLDEVLRGFAMRGVAPEMLTVIRRWEPTVRVTAYLEGNEVASSIDPFGIGDFSFTPIICFFDPEQEKPEMKLQSLIHGLVDSQRASDRKSMAILSWIEQQIGAGMDFEENTLVDPEDAFKTGSGSPRQFKKNALAEQRVRDRVVPDVPQGLFQSRQELNEDIPKMVNINSEMFGFPANDNLKIAGVLAKLRMGAGLVGLRDIFDNRGWSVKMIGSKQLKLLQQYPPSKVERITNRPASPAYYHRMFGKYDTVVAEGMLSDTQRSMAYAEMVALKELGLRIQERCPITWKRILSMAPIQQKQELLQEIEAEERRQAEIAQKQERLAEQLQQLNIEKMRSDINKDYTLAQQQQTASVENQTEAAWDRVQVLAKLQEMDNKKLIELMKIAKDLEVAKIGATNDNSR